MSSERDRRLQGRVIVFSDEKTWTVDPVRNRRNDRYLTFGEVDEDIRTMSTTKHPASVMSLGFVASNGKAMPLIWFPTGYRLNAVDYVKILQEKFLPWFQENFPDNNVVLQKYGAPAHTAKVTQEFPGQHMQFWSKD
ncbi:Putative transposable element, partial [Caligus rogercresseyi]